MSKVTMNEETRQQQLQVKQSIINIMSDNNVFIYTVDYSDLEIDGDLQQITIKYRDHEEVEITDDGNS